MNQNAVTELVQARIKEGGFGAAWINVGPVSFIFNDTWLAGDVKNPHTYRKDKGT